MGRFHRIELALIAAIAIAGCLASGLWFVTGYKSWKGTMLERRVNLGEVVSDHTLIDVWEHIDDLDQTYLSGRHVHFPGLAALLIMSDVRISIDKRAAVILDGEASISNALSREPANSAAWARLAWLRYLQKGPSKDAISAIRMSIYTAPANKSLVFWRIRMAAINREHWDDHFESLVRRQMIYASRISQRQLDLLLKELKMEDLSGA